MFIATPRLNRLPAGEKGITLADFLVPIRVGESLSSRARHIVLIVAGALLIYLTARIAVPVPGSPVPITGQTFGVLLVGGALGFRRGLAAVALYVLLGLVGLPVFAEGKDGLQVVLGATGGYLIGFVLAGSLVGRLAELGWDRKLLGALGAMAIGNALIYVIGLPWFAVVTGRTPAEAIQDGLLPFLVWDVVKLVLAAVLFPAAWWVVGRRPGER
ncbi:MAG TPA: biotin transporter BioY [Candidatus Limnocylindrales bacterium]|jgi:biotin transport system substrate-specific component|nr:biotin transporter BioY [Candidatus Limnocylindrales bacterium]